MLRLVLVCVGIISREYSLRDLNAALCIWGLCRKAVNTSARNQSVPEVVLSGAALD